MNYKKYFFLALFLFGGALFAEGPSKKVHVSSGKGGIKFYHLEFTLTPENAVKPFGESKYGPRKFESSDGQFEIFIKKDKFPVSSPAKEFIILRMPSGNHPSKLALFNSLKSMIESKKGSVKVILELNPYYIPEKNKLNEANVFFRTAKGAYIDRLDWR